MKCSWNTNIFDDSLLTDMIDSIDQKGKKQIRASLIYKIKPRLVMQYTNNLW